MWTLYFSNFFSVAVNQEAAEQVEEVYEEVEQHFSNIDDLVNVSQTLCLYFDPSSPALILKYYIITIFA